MAPFRVLVALLFVLLAFPGAARAASPSCADPQSAARSLLDWLQPDRYDPAAAATCLDVPTSRKDDAAGLAVKLKKVLDARGLYVPTDDLPDDPDYLDDESRHRVAPLPTLPSFVLHKRGERWLVSRELVQSIDTLYDETFSSLSGRVQDAIPPGLRVKVFGFQTWQVVYFVLLLLGALIVGRVTQRVLVGQLARLARRAQIELKAQWLERTQGPISWLAMGGVVRWGIPDLQLGVQASRALLFLANITVSFAAVLILVRLIDVGTDYFAQRAEATESKLDDQVIPLLNRTAKFVVWALGIVFILQNSGVNVLSLVAGLGIGGLAFALAAKDTVENLFGSITIFTDRPFQIGDWVLVDGKVEGVVEEVGFRSTRVRTFYNSVVSVPNGKVAAATIDNYGMRSRRRTVATLGLTYSTPREKLEAYTDAVRAYLAAHPKVYKQVLEVHFSGFGESALQIMVYFFLEVPDWHQELEERAAIYAHFLRLAEEIGVSFAFPSTSLYVESLPGQSSKSLPNSSSKSPPAPPSPSSSPSPSDSP